MLSKCANPACTTPFQYLRDGRLYQMETGVGPQLVTNRKEKPKVEYFWLCTRCSSEMTLSFERGKGVVTVPLVAPAKPAAKTAAAS